MFSGQYTIAKLTALELRAQVRNTPCFSPFVFLKKIDDLPRQARDKQRTMVTFFKMTFRHTQLPLLVEGGVQVYDAMFDFLEMFLAVPIHVMVRFGKWTVRIETAPLFPPSHSPSACLSVPSLSR